MNEQILKDFNVNKFTLIRYEKTLSFIKKTIPDQYRVLDLGVPNPFSEILNEKIGIRPILRKITPRYYIVYAERIQR